MKLASTPATKLREIARVRPGNYAHPQGADRSWIAKSFTNEDCDDLDAAADQLEICARCVYCFHVARKELS